MSTASTTTYACLFWVLTEQAAKHSCPMSDFALITGRAVYDEILALVTTQIEIEAICDVERRGRLVRDPRLYIGLVVPLYLDERLPPHISVIFARAHLDSWDEHLPEVLAANADQGRITVPLPVGVQLQ